MATRKQAQARADALGCQFSYDGAAMRLEAPAGKVFAHTGLHWRDIYNNPRGRYTAAEIYDEVLYELRDGLADCETPDCDACEGE